MSKYKAAHYHAAFEAADDAYRMGNTGTIVERLSSEHGIERGTAQAFVMCYARMMKGLVYKRGLSEMATEMFLNGIKTRHGTEPFIRAIQAARLHLAYRESIGHRLPGLQTLVDRLGKDT